VVGSRRSGDSRAASTGSGGNWRLAVVIPTHDRADLLRRSIESVLRQERTADQIIVVDDGSRDDTAAVVTGYGPTVTYVPKAHGGVASARNLGVAQSDADFIAFLDSDDHWDEGHLHRTEAAIEMTRGKAWLYFSDLRLDRDRETAESIWRACELEIHDTFAFREDGREWVLLPRQPMMIPAAVVRRDAYLAVGGQAENLTCREDTHFFLKLGLAGPINAVSGVAGEATNDDPNRLTERYKGRDLTYWRCTRWLYADILNRYPNLPPDPRGILRRRLADAHWTLGRISLQRRPVTAFAQVARAAYTDRRAVAARLRAWCA